MAKRKRTPSKPEITPDFIFEKELMLGAVQKALGEMKFDSPNEMQAFLDQLIGMRMEDVTQTLGGKMQIDTVESQADGMFFEAMEARTMFATKRKLAAVLKLDPDHVRTLTALAMMESNPQKLEQQLRAAIAAGERQLGPLLQEGKGHLWGFLEARPYMEARAELAGFLAGMEERLDDAIAEHQELLRLNENDNQGVRDPLLALLLEQRRFDEAGALLKQYDTDNSATWMYGKALLAFETHAAAAKWDTSQYDTVWFEQQLKEIGTGRVPVIPKQVRKADKALVKALEFNPWCALYLIRSEEMSLQPSPPSYSPGSREEARLFLDYQSLAWASNPAALYWLVLTSLPWLLENGFDSELEQAFG